ncbi:hypothetical protein SporoP37_08510 [Sporosarcina sp. P37]|uniref:hypothetical protein n=1 Tax=unclassified Sporosarcina TaxID=2647733 RepID=UPI0009BFDA93|nr:MULTISPECIES: hypothetical protein [unclassified Sporosarcina]ARD48181.1 hypothetical protein SporoP33_08055 [Sporosarcina sp. P33]ARK24697.1 hypothetical protein SporoP37_08510 [Sporosarcina sp. P37]PID19854.1 hypothetical protein CSV62_01045 [Sporosarcina sp. P35]
MRFFKYSFPIAVLVGTLAWIMLGNSYEEVAYDMRVYITIGAAIFSGLLSSILFRKEKEEQIDEKK